MTQDAWFMNISHQKSLGSDCDSWWS